MTSNGSPSREPSSREPSEASSTASPAARFAAALALTDYRRRVAGLYRAVRDADARGPDARAAAWRDFWTGRDDLFRHHPQSPLAPEARAAWPGAARFPYDPTARTVGRCDPALVDAEPLDVELAADGVFRMEPVARLRFELAGGERSLILYRIAGYGGGLFLPFADATSGRGSGAAASGEGGAPAERQRLGSYGGGRYLLDTRKHADLGDVAAEVPGDAATLRLDFNYAYQPSCAYHPRWDCPLAPPGNRLAVPVEAGEVYRAG